jgi:dienelactone hydrolase
VDRMKTMRITGVFAVAAMIASAVSAQPLKQGEKKDMDIMTGDRTVLKATYYSPGKPGPAVLLLHQCNMDRKSWEPLAIDLTNAGMHVMTLDFRGFGESGGEKITDPERRRAVMADTWPKDVDAAYTILIGLKGVDRSRLAVGGASCGVTQASAFASRQPDVKALVLLSGSASDAAKTYFSATPALAIFGAVSEDEAAATKGIKEALAASKNSRNTLKVYTGAGHGVAMFAKEAELEPMIVTWLKTQLGS